MGNYNPDKSALSVCKAFEQLFQKVNQDYLD